MQFSLATKLIHQLDSDGKCDDVRFIGPAVATTLAAATISNPRAREVQFVGEARPFAELSGLASILAGSEPRCGENPSTGRNYSSLTLLQNHDDVDHCNSTIVDLLAEQLPGAQIAVSQIGSIVGELHDNVASHANGAGYSAAQVYNRADGKHIEFAVSDGGIGMLHHVHKFVPDIVTDRAAIEWCIGYRHTTVPPRGEWAQKVPRDIQSSPFGTSVETYVDQNHHIGLGLYKLVELVRRVSGGLCIWSGDAQLTFLNDKLSVRSASTPWSGVAIELSLSVEKVIEAETSTSIVVDPRWGF